MKMFKYLGAAAVGAMMFASSANAVTVNAENGVGMSGTGACVSAACTTTSGLLAGPGTNAAFALPGDFDVLGGGLFNSLDTGAVFTHTFEFVQSLSSAVFNFNTINQPSDFMGLTYSWFGHGLPVGGLVLSGAATPVATGLFFAMGKLYTLVIAGTYISTGSGDYDWSLESGAPPGFSPVPLPAALPLFGTGLGILGFLGWRRRRNQTA